MSSEKEVTVRTKNTFLEFGHADDKNSRRTRSDHVGEHGLFISPHLAAAKSPLHSPSLLPVDEAAVPSDLALPPAGEGEVGFDLLELDPGDGVASSSRGGGNVAAFSGAVRRPSSSGGYADPTAAQNALPGSDEPAYVVPMTPSPFLHSSFPPSNLSVPPFGYYGMDALPPAFEDAENPYAFGAGDGTENPYLAQGFDPSAAMFDPTFGAYMPYGGWGAGLEGLPGSKDGVSPWDPSAIGMGASAGSKGLADSWENMDVSALEARGKGSKLSGAREGRDSGRDAMSMRDQQRGQEGKRGGPKGRGREEQSGTRSGAMDSVNQVPPCQVAPGNPENYTTVMLRNIPNKYTREMLINQLNVDYKGCYDFMYLPIDFKNKCNVGYGFINFRTPEVCSRFVTQFHGVDVRRCLPGLNSKKVVEVTPARVQGAQENVRRLRNSPVMNQLADHPDWMPLLFADDGQMEPFPLPDQLLPAVKPRGRLTGKAREKA